eukprot:m.163871 g.163871  ORF g.163871 m.163871 type:complete len:124 (+) comp18111_c0_seq24:2676-3047(+)
MCDVELLSSPRLQASQAAEKQRMQDDGDEIDEMRENEFYLSRLDAGLCTLQHIDCIIGDVVFKCGKQARNRVVRLLELKKSSLETIIGTLYEFVDNLDDDVNSRNRKEHILDTIVVLRDSVQS